MSQTVIRRRTIVVVSGLLIASIAGNQFLRSTFAQQPPTAASQPAELSDAKKAELLADLQSRSRALAGAQSDLAAASLAWPPNDADVTAKLKSLAECEFAFAQAQATASSQQQQTAAIKAAVNRGRRIPNIPRLTSAQSDALTQMAGLLIGPDAALSAARAVVTKLAVTRPNDAADLKLAVDAVMADESTLAKLRVDAFTLVQESANKLAADQVTALAAMNGILQLGGFSQPRPIDFNDHDGYVSLFDCTTLKGWDGNPKIWRVENGNIIGESTPTNPSGNTYLVYRDQQAKDFTLKFEIKIDGNGGSGMQYRSRTGIPWLAPVAENLRPVNLNWMMTGPQADFWPSQVYSGQFYSENTPMRIIAWRGQVVESAGMGTKRLMGTIGDRKALGEFEHKNDWNQYTVIARGGTFIHIMNGQLMAVLVDDDPTSSNNQSGLIGIEIESITKLYVRNIWLKKLD
jgi:hypothetical protein